MILTNEEIREALFLDDDFPSSSLTEYGLLADAFIVKKTGYDYANNMIASAEPLAKLLAKLYLKSIYYEGFHKDEKMDYSIGINGLIGDLKDIARANTGDS